jgi:hypothetical protein
MSKQLQLFSEISDRPVLPPGRSRQHYEAWRCILVCKKKTWQKRENNFLEFVSMNFHS